MHKQWREVLKKGFTKWLGLGSIKGHGWTCHLECHEKVIECDWWYIMSPIYPPTFNDLLQEPSTPSPTPSSNSILIIVVSTSSGKS